MNYSIKKLLKYSINNNLKHIPSALSQFSYLKYVLPVIKKDFNIVIGKPFGSQAYYTIWEELGYIKKDDKLSYGVKHEELDFVSFSEETLGNALGVASGIATVSDKVTYCNISDGALQMGPTLESIMYIGKNKQKILLTVDCNDEQLTGNTNDILNINSSKIRDIFKMYDWNVYLVPIYLQDKNVKIFTKEDMIQIIETQHFDNKPTVLIFETIKGYGVTEMEDDPVKWHYKSLKDINEVTIK